MISIGQLAWTIQEFYYVFPDYAPQSFNEPGEKYEKLYKLFHDQMTDKQIKWFRANWHNWRINKDPIAETNIKDFIKQYLS